MYGDFEMITTYGPPDQSTRNKRYTEYFDFDVPGIPDLVGEPGEYPEPDNKGDSYFKNWRAKRQAQSLRNSSSSSSRPNNNQQSRRNENDPLPTDPNPNESTGR